MSPVVLGMDIDGGPPVPETGVRMIVTGEVEDAMQKVVRVVEREWKRISPSRTGAYRRSITGTSVQVGDSTVGQVEPDPLSPAHLYAAALEEGTGVFGPLHRPIPGALFRFRDRGAGTTRYGRPFPPPSPPMIRIGTTRKRSVFIYSKRNMGIVPFHLAEKAYATTFADTQRLLRAAAEDAADQIRAATRGGGLPIGGGLQLTRRLPSGAVRFGGVVR